jgi:hypothetical protein
MAKVRTAARAAAPVRAGLDISALAGTFAYKFSGYAMSPDRQFPFFLTGLGKFQLDASGNLTGAHRSAFTPLQGSGASLATGAYDLNGTMTIRNDGTGEANILFTKTLGDGTNVRGQFYVLVAGNADRLWMISSGARVPETGAEADELVNLEAVRVA